MNQREIQIWNDAVAACRAAAWAEVEAIGAAAANGMPHPARAAVRAVGSQRKAGDERQAVITGISSADFPDASNN